MCGDAIVAANFEKMLAAQKIYVKNGSELVLLVDRPSGWASLEHPQVHFQTCIILTGNLCPTYRLDLLEREPAALVDIDSSDETLKAVIGTVSVGNTIYPKVLTLLTPKERYTLKMMAAGYSNKEIANARNVNESTVKNSVFEIYKKLNLKSRVQATHYYYGNWHLLSHWKQPILEE